MLTEIEIDIIYRRNLGHTYREIAGDYGISKQRIHQIYERAERRLRDVPLPPEALDKSSLENVIRGLNIAIGVCTQDIESAIAAKDAQAEIEARCDLEKFTKRLERIQYIGA